MKIISHIIIPNVYSLYLDTMQIYYKQSLDAKLSSGIDNLVEKMPALKEATPVFYDSTR